MKKHLLVLSILCFIFVSCHKDKQETGGYYVKYKLNGAAVTSTSLNYSSIGPNATIAGMTDFQFGSTSNDFKNFIGIAVQKYGGLGTGKYESSNNALIVTVDYFKDQASATERDYTIADAPAKPASAFTVNITSITTDNIRGTFTGNYLYDQGANESIELTDGEFFVRRNQ